LEIEKDLILSVLSVAQRIFITIGVEIYTIELQYKYLFEHIMELSSYLCCRIWSYHI